MGGPASASVGQNATCEQPGLGQRELDVRPARRPQPRPGPQSWVGLGDTVEPSLHRLLELVGGDAGDLAEQLVAVGEVPVRRVVRDARTPRDLAQHDPVRARRTGQLGAGLDEGGAEVAVVVRLRGHEDILPIDVDTGYIHVDTVHMRSRLPVLLTVCAAVLAINLDTTIVNVALPSISTDLDAGTRALQWIVDGYNLAFAALVLAAGSLSDRYGRRPALILGLLGFAAASAVGALVDSAGALVAARVAMGMAAAVIFPTTLSIITNTFRERRERAAALGVWGAVVGIGVAAGPVTGGVLLEHFAWGSVFWAWCRWPC